MPHLTPPNTLESLCVSPEHRHPTYVARQCSNWPGIKTGAPCTRPTCRRLSVRRSKYGMHGTRVRRRRRQLAPHADGEAETVYMRRCLFADRGTLRATGGSTSGRRRGPRRFYALARPAICHGAAGLLVESLLAAAQARVALLDGALSRRDMTR